MLIAAIFFQRIQDHARMRQMQEASTVLYRFKPAARQSSAPERLHVVSRMHRVLRAHEHTPVSAVSERRTIDSAAVLAMFANGAFESASGEETDTAAKIFLFARIG